MKKIKYALLGLFSAASALAATTYTTNYSLQKPSDGSTSWGSSIRDSFDTIDSQMYITATTASDHIADTVGAHAATAISATSGSVCTSATTVQAFLTCLDTNYNAIAAGGAVSITGDETISGAKTFSAVLTATSGLSTSGTVTLNGVGTGPLISSSGVVSTEAQLASTRGGTGVSNAGTLTYGANDIAITTSGATTLTLPTTGTVATLAGTETLTNKTFDADGTGNSITNIEDADIKSGAAIARAKLASGTASHVIINDGSGVMSSEASLAITRGGTGQATAAAGFDALAPTTTNGDMIVRAAGTNARLAVGNSGQVLKVVGTTPTWSSFSGGVNYLSANPDAEGGTTGMVVYADAAGASPVDGTGGSANVTITQSASSPLRGSNSFLLTKDAANRQGQGVSYDFTIDRADLAKPLMVSFDYEGGGSFSPSDIVVYLYDKDASQLIQPAPYTLSCNVSVQCKFISYFQTSSSSDDYRVIWHVSTTNASATTFKFDNVYVGPDKQTYGAVSSDYAAYTPTIGATITPPTQGAGATKTVYWRRVGDSMQIIFDYVQTNAGASGSGAYQIPLPSGYTIDTTKQPVTTENFGRSSVGAADAYDGSISWVGSVVAATSTALEVQFLNQTTGMSSWGSGAVALGNANARISFNATIPIAGWSSNTVMSNDTETRVIAASATGSTTSLTSSFATIVFPTVAEDRSGSYNSSTGVFTAPVSGTYVISGFFQIGTGVSYGANQGVFLAYKKNSATAVQIGNWTATATATVSPGVSGAASVSLSAGDTLVLQGASTVAASIASTANNVSIFRLSGPATIAASETVAARYTTDAGQSIANAATPIVDFEDKDYDTHNAVTVGASWKFTAPMSGKYSVKSYVRFANSLAWTQGQYVSAQIYKNGSAVANGDTAIQSTATLTNGPGAPVNDTVNLLAGDYIDIRASHGESAARALITAPQLVRIAIERVGN